MSSWTDDLTPAERDRLLAKLAWEIKKRKLEAPAVLFFEMNKPLSFVGSQGGVFFAPFLVPFFGHDNVRDYTRLFSDRSNVERLLLLIEGSPDNLHELINPSAAPIEEAAQEANA